MKTKYMKIYIITLSIFIVSLLCGCNNKKDLSIYDKKYTLINKNGSIVCKDFDYVVCLEKDKDKEFKILNLSDIQLEDYEISFEYDVAVDSLQLIKELIFETKPDLITLSGDQGYGESISINAIAETIDSFDIPWAYVFGNHDQECRGLSLKEQIELYGSYKNCISKMGPEEIIDSESGMPRMGNYIINIVEKDIIGFHIVRSIFMLNSGIYHTYDTTSENRLNNGNYEHLTDKQLEFYKWGLESAKKYNKGKYPKSTIIEHIPITGYAFAFAEAFNSEYTVYEYNDLYSEAKKYSVEDSYSGICWKDGYKDSFGICHETICCSPYDDGIFEILKEYGSTDSMIVGHDHANNFSIDYQGIKLTFSMKTGKGSYYDENLNGGTVLTFDGKNDVKITQIYK